MSAGGVAARAGGPRAGIYGKLPARGDFVRAGLPRDFVDPWDAWWQRGIAATRGMAGAEWTAAWLEAPVWRFVLPPGLLGEGGAMGVWMPSVDRAGRYFPLTIAAVAPFDWAGRPGAVAPFLAGAERAGLDALEQDLGPEEVLRRTEAALGEEEAGGPEPAAILTPALTLGRALWWTDGGPRVAPCVTTGPALPEGAVFAALIDDSWPQQAERIG